MKNALVFAYGSNMNARQMAARCPGAERVCVGRLPDHRIEFAGRSARWGGGGVANIRPARRSSVVGVVWLLSAANLERLDGFEGHPYVYDRTPVLVDRSSGKSLWCYTYIKNDADEKTTPTPEYLRTILEGYKTAGAAVPGALKRLYSLVSHGQTA
jgi:gamma-glutamylcyclotransferase